MLVAAFALDPEGRAHDCPLAAKLELERDLGHQPVGRAIFLALDDGRRLGVEGAGVDHPGHLGRA